MATKTTRKITVSRKIKDALEDRRSRDLVCTQRWLAKVTGIPEDKLSTKLRNNEFEVPELAAIEDALGISLL